MHSHSTHYLIEQRLFVFVIQGGGHCGSENDCNVQARGILGSSHHWPELKTGRSLLSLDSTLNKDFRNWNHVDIPVTV